MCVVSINGLSKATYKQTDRDKAGRQAIYPVIYACTLLIVAQTVGKLCTLYEPERLVSNIHLYWMLLVRTAVAAFARLV